MESEISAITLEATKLLARIYPTKQNETMPLIDLPPPPSQNTSSSSSGGGEVVILDSFFAADFMTHHPTRRPANTSSIVGNTSKTTHMDIEDESYGTKYIRYLNKFRIEKAKVEKGKDLVDTIIEAINGPPEVVAEYKVRESILARAIIVQAQIEAGKRDRAHGERLAEEFVKAKMDNGLWCSIQAHLHCSDNNEDASAGRSSGGGSSPVVGVDELEMAVELLFIFSHWSLALKREEIVTPGAQSLLRVCLAVELFSRYAARQSQLSLSSALSRRHHRAHGHQQQQQQPDVGRLQRIRLGHKALHLLDITWGILIGDEAEAMRRMSGSSGSSNAEDFGSSVATRGLRPSGLARDALRQIRDSCERYPELSAEVNSDIERLLPFIHPFDGHLTRSAQLGRFGPISSSSRDQITAQQAADAVHSVSMPRASLAEDSCGTVPKAAREAVAAYVRAAQLTRSEREYGEWWRRLVGTRGWPMSLTINGGVRGNDIILNPLQQQQQQHFHGGIIEAEDMAALELALDNKLDACGWPPGTDSEPGAGARAAFYCALFPLLPVLCRALVRTIAAWAPAERELSAAPAPAGLVSEVSGLGIIAYPKWELPAPAATASAAAHLLGGSNVQRLDRTASRSASSSSINTASSNSNSSSSRSAKNGGGVVVVAGLAARLLTQYAQWEVIGRFLMRLLAGLQANHILQVGYVAQLLVNENIIPAIFWWLGTADLQLGISLPLAVRRRSFTAEYALELRRVDPQAVQSSSSSSSFLSSASSSVLSAKQSALCWRPALQGLVDCCRALRRLTAHDGMRKGLLYKNKALYFYSRVMSVPLLPLRRVVAELYRDIVPILSRAKKMAHMDILSCVFLYAPPLLSDSYWLSEYFVDPLVEMHRHVELLRLLHFYHFECFGLFLPQNSALFPSLVARVVDLPLKPADANTSNTTSAAAGEIRPRSMPAGRHGRTASSGKYRRPGVVTPAPASCSLQSASAAGVLMSEHSWIKWDSELEETLNQVYINKS